MSAADIERFEFAFSPAYRRVARLFGVGPANAEVTVSASELTVRFGLWRLNTSLENIRDVSITGPYRFIKTAGPPRLAITDRGISFATNSRRGVLLHLERPVAGIEPTGLLRHPELTLTLHEIERFTALISAAPARH